jgi:hypothetical protein
VIERREDKMRSICSGVSRGFTEGWRWLWDIGGHAKNRHKGKKGKPSGDWAATRWISPSSLTVNLPSELDPNANPEQRRP